MLKRIFIMFCNIFFPPLAVMLLTGVDMDLAINCMLFLLAIIPSHVHGFYISWTYFGRKRKVRKGQYPGPWRSFIYSEKVQYGGATRAEVEMLKAGNGMRRGMSKISSRTSGADTGYAMGESMGRQSTRRSGKKYYN